MEPDEDSGDADNAEDLKTFPKKAKKLFVMIAPLH